MHLGCPYCDGELERERGLLLEARPEEVRSQLWRCGQCYVPFYARLTRDPDRPPDEHEAEEHLFWNLDESSWQTFRARMRLCKSPETSDCRCDQHDYFRKVGTDPVGGERADVTWTAG